LYAVKAGLSVAGQPYSGKHSRQSGSDNAPVHEKCKKWQGYKSVGTIQKGSDIELAYCDYQRPF
jgi:hypothetical protein